MSAAIRLHARIPLAAGGFVEITFETPDIAGMTGTDQDFVRDVLGSVAYPFTINGEDAAAVPGSIIPPGSVVRDTLAGDTP